MTDATDGTPDPTEHNYSLTRAVAAQLPFPVDLDVDMSYMGVLSIDLGRRGGVDDPPDTASIDFDVEPVVWMLDIEGGRETIASELGPDADTAVVAEWIADQARRAGSPAAQPARLETDALP